MKVGLGYLQQDYYLVLRWFGKNHLYKVMAAPEFRPLCGWYVRVRHASLDCDPIDEAFLDRMHVARKGMRMYRLPFYVRLSPWLDMLFGRPRWHAFFDRNSVREHLSEEPDFGLFDLIEGLVMRCLPPRGAAWTMTVVAVVASVLFPFHWTFGQGEEEW